MSGFDLLETGVVISETKTVRHGAWGVVGGYRAVSRMNKLSVRIFHLGLSLVEDARLAFRGLGLLRETSADISSTGKVGTISLISDIDVWAAVFALVPDSVISTCNWSLTSSQESCTACHSVSVVLGGPWILRTLLFASIMARVWVVVMADVASTIAMTTTCNSFASFLMLHRISNQALSSRVLESGRALDNTLTDATKSRVGTSWSNAWSSATI